MKPAFIADGETATANITQEIEALGDWRGAALARIAERRAAREGELHDQLVRLTGADDAFVRPDRRAHPFPLLSDAGVGLVDELATRYLG